MVSNEFMLELVSKTDIFEELRLGHITLDNDEQRSAVRRTLMIQNNDEIELDILKAYLEAEKKYGDADKNLRYHALQLKYEALTTIPSTIEKTMTPAQLYSSNSPLWTVELTARGIDRFINWEKYNGKLPKILFDDYYNNAKQGIYFDDNVDFDSLYPASITNLKKGI